MGLKQSFMRRSVDRQFSLPDSLGGNHQLLSTLFSSSTVGVAICDRQFRFQAINDALASMNGFPVEAHLGKTLHAMLGSVAAIVQPAFEHVFATGQSLVNYEVTAELPTRKSVGHWSESYFPIKDRKGVVRQVGCVVLELTQPRAIAASLGRLTDNLVRVNDALRAKPRHQPERRTELGRPAAELLEKCLSAVRTISTLLQPERCVSPVPPLRPLKLVCVKPKDSDEAVDFACPYPLEQAAGENSLSSREREVAILLARGKTNREVAAILIISSRTVESHRAKIMLKLGLHSVTDLVRYALRTHLIQS